MSNTINNVLAGILIAIINITVAISSAALIFSGTEPQLLTHGIVVLLVGTIIIGIAGTLFSGFGGVICAPRSGLAPVFAAIISSIYVLLQPADSEQMLPTMLMTIMMTSAVIGVFLILLGQLKLGKLVRYIPYPVMGGFFAGIGFIFVKGGLAVAMGESSGLDVIEDQHLLQIGVSAVVFAIALYVFLNKFGHWSTFPLTLLLGFSIFYLVFYLSGQTFEGAIKNGWLPEIESTPELLFPLFTPADLSQVNWSAIATQSGGMVVAALLSAIILLLDVSGIEIITQRDLNPNRELKMMGLANVASGVTGGYPGVHVASDTAFTFKLGGDGRLMGFTYLVVLILTLLAGTDFIAKILTFILGGLLVYVGIDFLIDWTWKTRSELPIADYLIVLLILAVIAFVDILEGVAFGFAVAMVLFVFNYSRLSVIKAETTGRDRASNIDRDLKTRQLLNAHGDSVRILILQGFIFFGTSDKLITEIRQRISSRDDDVDFLILDFYHVSQLDTSAVKAFLKIVQLANRYKFHVIVTGANEALTRKLEAIDFFSDESAQTIIGISELNDGVAWCEEQILKRLALGNTDRSKNLIELLTQITDDKSFAIKLAPYFTEELHDENEYLFA